MVLGTPLLLCVDLQMEFIAPGRPWADPDGEELAQSCISVLDHARRSGWTIVHTQLHQGGPMLEGGGAMPRSIPGCAPRREEVLLKRAGISAFAHPDLDGVLAACQEEGSVMIGFTAPMSLTTTLYDAADRGHSLKLLEEACGAAHVGEWGAEHTRALCLATAEKLGRLTSLADYDGALGQLATLRRALA
ncbi:MAG: isochorismatase family protein [Pseudomonadota bacterium]